MKGAPKQHGKSQDDGPKNENRFFEGGQLGLEKNVAALHIQFVVKKVYLGNKMLSKYEKEELNRIE